MDVRLPRVSVEEEEEEASLLEFPDESTYSGATRSVKALKAETKRKKKKKPWIFLVVLALVLVAMIDVGAYLGEPPKTRLYEANICLSYYRQHDASVIGGGGTIDERLCKIDAVQQKLAMVFGWQDTFDAMPGILLAIPFGTLADRVGRKWIFVASLVGCWLSSAWILVVCYFKTLPLQLTWLSSAFFLVGGGPLVAVAVAMTMIVDIAPPDKRTTVFLYLTASVLVAEMVAPVMAAKLMEKGDWTPLLLSLALQAAGISIGVFFPETLHLRDLPESSARADDNDMEVQPKLAAHFTFTAQLNNFRTAYTFIRSDVQLALVVFGFMGNRLGRQAMSLLIRYASKRYEWEIKRAAYLLTFRAATNLVAVAVFLPAMNWFLLKYLRLATHWADLWIARGSVMIQAVSFFIMGVAGYPALLVFGLLVYNLGTGYSAALRSVAIHTVGGQSSPDVGKLMSTIAISEAIGAMFAGPFLSQLLQWGMDLGSAWLGLPFLACVPAFAVMTVTMFAIRMRDREVGYVQVQMQTEDEEDVVGGLGRSSALDDDDEP